MRPGEGHVRKKLRSKAAGQKRRRAECFEFDGFATAAGGFEFDGFATAAGQRRSSAATFELATAAGSGRAEGGVVL